MEDKIHKSYQDKWKKFMMRALRNIDFLNAKEVTDEIIEEITYKVKIVSYNAGTYLFQQNKKCTDIIIVVNGGKISCVIYYRY